MNTFVLHIFLEQWLVELVLVIDCILRCLIDLVFIKTVLQAFVLLCREHVGLLPTCCHRGRAAVVMIEVHYHLMRHQGRPVEAFEVRWPDLLLGHCCPSKADLWWFNLVWYAVGRSIVGEFCLRCLQNVLLRFSGGKGASVKLLVAYICEQGWLLGCGWFDLHFGRWWS